MSGDAGDGEAQTCERLVGHIRQGLLVDAFNTGPYHDHSDMVHFCVMTDSQWTDCLYRNTMAGKLDGDIFPSS